jgi:hypothetical protein
MSKTRWLVCTGSTLNVIVAGIAIKTGNVTAGVILIGVSVVWVIWAFARDRG